MFEAIRKSTTDGSKIKHRNLPSEYAKIHGHPSKAVKIPGKPHEDDGKFIHKSTSYAGRSFSNDFI